MLGSWACHLAGLTVCPVVLQPTPREWSAMTLELSQHSSPLVPTLMCPERRSRLGELQSIYSRSGIPTELAAPMNRSDIRGIACSATWFQRGQQVRTQASARLDHRATIWGT